jgi:hypothetical protein
MPRDARRNGATASRFLAFLTVPHSSALLDDVPRMGGPATTRARNLHAVVVAARDSFPDTVAELEAPRARALHRGCHRPIAFGVDALPSTATPCAC